MEMISRRTHSKTGGQFIHMNNGLQIIKINFILLNKLGEMHGIAKREHFVCWLEVQGSDLLLLYNKGLHNEMQL